MSTTPLSAQSPQVRRLTVWIIWFSLLMAVGIYGVVGTLSLSESDPAPGPDAGGDGSLLSILTLLAAGQILAGFAIRFVFLSRPALAGELDLESETGFQRYLTIQIVIFAITEAVAIYGLVLFLTGQVSPATFHRFLFAAGLALLLHAPIQSGSESHRRPASR